MFPIYKDWNTIHDFAQIQSGGVDSCYKQWVSLKILDVWELSDFTENHMVCDWQVYISFRLWFNTVIGYQTCLLFWANFITFVLYLHTRFHVSVSLLCSERLQNCVVFSSLKLLWIKVSAKWINVNVNIKNVKVWIWALKTGLISAELILPIRRIHKLRRAPETPGDPLALKDVLIIV